MRTVHDHPSFAPTPLPTTQSAFVLDAPPAPTLGGALFMPLDDLARLRVGHLNLLCATGLPDTANLNVGACLRTLDEWSHLVRRETDRQMHQFRRSPGDFEHSESYFRTLVMVTVLQRDLGVKYDADAAERREFRSSREGFIHGLLTGERTGTCANMPVLYAAVGRNLGYPIYIVPAKGHLLCRWHDARTGERFNIEGSSRGLNVHPDEFYRSWPRAITDAEVHHGIYLRNLDPAEELGHFMRTRGQFLAERGHLLDAIVAHAHAHRLAPTDPVCMAFLLDALNREIARRDDGTLPCTYRQAEVFNRADCPPLKKFVLDARFSDGLGWTDLDHLDAPTSSQLTPNA